MKIGLNVLDEYAKSLSNKQYDMLYEGKMGKKYEKKLYESVDSKYPLKLHLSEKNIMNDSNKSKGQFMYDMSSKFNTILESVKYKIEDDEVYFKTTSRKAYGKLCEALMQNGMKGCTIEKLQDKNF